MTPAQRSGIAAVCLLCVVACSKSVSEPKPPATVSYVVGWVTDSITPASRLYQAPWWVFIIYVLGADAQHSGLAYQGSIGRDEKLDHQFCLGPAGQVLGERQLAYVALGDTLYSADSVAYWTLVNRLGSGFDSLRPVMDSALAGQLRGRIPGLVALTTGLFDPTVSLYSRGDPVTNAIVQHWSWTDQVITFAEDTSAAGKARCVPQH